MKAIPPETRIWNHIEFEPMSGCWLWTGCVYGGYGYFGNPNGTKLVHKFMYEMQFGPVPRGFELDHKCRLKCCVNYRHMEVVTHAENVRRGDAMITIKKAKLASIASWVGRTHCKWGHEFTGGVRPNGSRICRECMNMKRIRHRKSGRKGNPGVRESGA